MTAPAKTTHTYRVGGKTRTIIGWRDDDRPEVPPDKVVGASQFALPMNEVAIPITADLVALTSPYLAGDRMELTGRWLVARTHAQIPEHNPAIACIWTTNYDEFMSRTLHGPGVAIDDFRGHCDFHSTALWALTDIALTIKSVLEDWREVLSGYLDDDSESTGLSYTDRLADYPPLPRKYEDVEVVIGGENEIQPRRYTDEDLQVWRT